MKQAILVLLCGACLLNAPMVRAQQVKQTRSTETIQAVYAGGGIDVFLTQDEATTVVVEAPAAAQGNLRTTGRCPSAGSRASPGKSCSARPAATCACT
ncbi:hypothetical protein [Hymenobacter fastidiosus]|uniref:hypothetical protein n=1 Tax=Hymenobacter fastidiosus TaxID=486264 RepID=UPI0031EC01DC